MWWSSWLDRVRGRRTPDVVGTRRLRGRLPAVPVGRRAPMRVVYTDAVVHETYTLKARVLQRAARLVFKPLLQLTPINDRSLATLRSLDRLSARGPRSRYVEPVRHDLGGVPVESMTHRYGPTSEMSILYLHGGGFFSCGIETHRRICERLAYYTGATVTSVEYRQLPEGTVADSVQDAITAYAALADTAVDPAKIVVAGDSAGGYLTMKIAELATRRGLPAPAALLTFSPLLSLDPERTDKGIDRVTRIRDAYLPMRRIPKIRERWMPEGALIEGYASPLLATAYITSPAFFVAVEDEMLRPEIEAMALRLAERGNEVETHLWRGQVHAFPVLADALPESKQAIQLAAAFARRAVGELPPEEAEVVDAELVEETPDADEEIIDVDLETPEADSRRRWFFQAS
ncbi:MAG: alpha/beta hydrolase [Actinomycetales bacterium]|nr:MAG: alpha/beta hydrolase [Actinomycetales bacterium]